MQTSYTFSQLPSDVVDYTIASFSDIEDTLRRRKLGGGWEQHYRALLSRLTLAEVSRLLPIAIEMRDEGLLKELLDRIEGDFHDEADDSAAMTPTMAFLSTLVDPVIPSAFLEIALSYPRLVTNLVLTYHDRVCLFERQRERRGRNAPIVISERVSSNLTCFVDLITSNKILFTRVMAPIMRRRPENNVTMFTPLDSTQGNVAQRLVTLMLSEQIGLHHEDREDLRDVIQRGGYDDDEWVATLALLDEYPVVG